MARHIKYDRSRRARAQVQHLEVGDALAFGGYRTVVAIQQIGPAELDPAQMSDALAYEGWNAYRMTLDDGRVLDRPAFLYFHLVSPQGATRE